MPDNRELASLIWLTLFVIGTFAQKNLRSSFGSVLRAFFNPVIFLPLLMMFGYIGLEVWVGSKLSMWRIDLLKPTVLWALGSAAVLFFKSSEAARQPGFFRKTVRQTVAVSVFVEFFMNRTVMNLVAELLLIPTVLFFSLIPVVAKKPSDLPATRLSEVMLAVIGFSLLAFTARQLYLTRTTLDVQQVTLQFVLPIWLTVGILPFIAIWSLVLTYDWTMRGINWATADRRARWRTRFVLVTHFHLKQRQLRNFNWNWIKRLTSAPDLKNARSLVEEYDQSVKEANRVAAEEQKRLKQFAGSDAVDANGRRLDRREFNETVDALRWLATLQMGCFEQNSRSYRTDLFTLFAGDFTRRGLPKDPGIVMHVRTDGQAWYAYRRTITGWYFAIGSAGPPHNEWEYDGPEPPTGFPGEDPKWGETFDAGEINVNWTAPNGDSEP